MLKRDYILAMIEDFFKAISILIQQRRTGNTGSSLTLIQRCYGSLHLEENDRLHSNPDELSKKLEADEKPPLSFMEILANLLMEESYLNDAEDQILLKRALDLMEYVDQKDNTFSLDRKEKIEIIKAMLTNKADEGIIRPDMADNS